MVPTTVTGLSAPQRERLCSCLCPRAAQQKEGFPVSSPPGARVGPTGRGEETHLWEPSGQALPVRKGQSIDWGAVILQAAESLPLLRPAAIAVIGKQPHFPGKAGESGLLCLPCALGTLPSFPVPSRPQTQGTGEEQGFQTSPTPPFPPSAPDCSPSIAWLPTTQEVLVTSMPSSLTERETPSHTV